MSAIATLPAAPKLSPSPGSPLALSQPGSGPGVTATAANPQERGGQVLFELPFTSPMLDADLALLRRMLDISTHMYPKMRPDPNSPGTARLDDHSGLFLERGPGEDEWLLQARTWGRPSPRTIHEWHLAAAQAARQLDPRVRLPERAAQAQLATAEHPVGAADTRLARIRRRLAGLP